MVKAIIVDDEKKGRDSLRNLVKNFCQGITIVGEAENVDEAEKLINLVEPDIVFLDIEMPTHNGFELFNRFTEINFKPIFTTAYNQYAIKAFKYSAIDYLLKPIDPEELQEAVNRYEKFGVKGVQESKDKLSKFIKQENKLGISTVSGIVFIDIEDIVRCEASRNYTEIYLNGGNFVTASKNLQEFESILLGKGFLRIHRSHLINSNRILKIVKGTSAKLILDEGTELPISNSRKDDLLDNFLIA